MATHSSILAWGIPWMEEPGGLQSRGHKESDTTERLHFLSLSWKREQQSKASAGRKEVGLLREQKESCHC